MTIFVTLRPYAQSEPKIRATNLQKSAKINLTALLIILLRSRSGIESLSSLVEDDFLER